METHHTTWSASHGRHYRAAEPRTQDFVEHDRHNLDPALRLRAHLLLLLAAGCPWATIAAVLFCSTRTIARWGRRFEQGGGLGCRAIASDTVSAQSLSNIVQRAGRPAGALSAPGPRCTNRAGLRLS
jgi:hypothetical protein